MFVKKMAARSAKLAKALTIGVVITNLIIRRQESPIEAGDRDLPARQSGNEKAEIVRLRGASLASRKLRPKYTNAIAATLMVALTGLFSIGAGFYWPDTSGPPAGRPTIAGLLFSVDKPSIDGGVRILINPAAEEYTGGPLGLMDVAVDLNVPSGETVHWALKIDAVSTAISLKKLQSPASEHSGYLIRAPAAYTLPPPIDGVRDYLLVGEIRGPSNAYSQLISTNPSLPAASEHTSITNIAWSGPLPSIFQGAYVAVSMPSLMSVPFTFSGQSEGFRYGWKPYPLKVFHAVEKLALPADYQIDSGIQTSGLLT